MKKPKFTDLAKWPHPYKPSTDSDITASWARARKKLEEEKKERERIRRELDAKLTTLRFK